MADAEEEPEIVVGEFDVFGLGGVEEGLQFGEGFARDEDALFAAYAFEGFSTKERRWPSVATMAMDSAFRMSRAPLRV